ncbi:MAG: hypothetical protein WC464_01580 [Bdellovibrionales bacterium]
MGKVGKKREKTKWDARLRGHDDGSDNATKAPCCDTGGRDDTFYSKRTFAPREGEGKERGIAAGACPREGGDGHDDGIFGTMNRKKIGEILILSYPAEELFLGRGRTIRSLASISPL